jgi:hypothetical protein
MNNSTDRTKTENTPHEISKTEIDGEYFKVIKFIAEMIKDARMSQEDLAVAVSRKYNFTKKKFSKTQSAISKSLHDTTEEANFRVMGLHELIAFAHELKIDITFKRSSSKGVITIAKGDDEFFCRVNTTAKGDKITTTDPRSEMFRGLNNKYYCYFLPTFRESVQEDEKVWVEGILTIDNTKNPVSANFIITGQKSTIQSSANNKPNLGKEYKGEFIYANPKNHGHLHCILHGKNFADLSFFTFKYTAPNTGFYDCTIAEVLTVCAGLEPYPTSHRMFLSRRSIDDADIIEKIMPNLRMNNNITFDKIDNSMCLDIHGVLKEKYYNENTGKTQQSK